MAGGGDLIVSVSGIRGIVGESLRPGDVTAFAAALGTYCRGGKIVLSRDSRPSGIVLRHAVLAGLLGTGCEVQDLSITPTPTCGLAIGRLQAAGAVQITASHNPAPWNGLKLFGSDGAVLSPAKGREVKKLYEARAFNHALWDRLGQLSECHEAEDWHRERILQLIDVPRIRSRGFRVLLDANAGAGGFLGLALLNSLQCWSEVIAGIPDGAFIHPPEPLAENLANILPKVTQAGADVGFVLDPDADRLAIIDEQGRYIGEELTLALAVWSRLRQERGPVVINMSSSRVVEDIAARYGVACQRAPVGEANVVEKMRELGALIGGEGNGGVIDPRVGWVRDPFIGVGLILDLMAETGSTLSSLASQLPRYEIVKVKIDVAPERLAVLMEAVEKRWPEAHFDRRDGLRLDWPDRWLHIRPSNTEPIVRLIAEAQGPENAKKLCREVSGLLT